MVQFSLSLLLTSHVSVCYSLFLSDAVAVVGLERTFYTVTEDVDVVEVCAIVEYVDPCPISFPFEVILSTRDGSAGSHSSSFF